MKIKIQEEITKNEKSLHTEVRFTLTYYVENSFEVKKYEEIVSITDIEVARANFNILKRAKLENAVQVFRTFYENEFPPLLEEINRNNREIINN